ncbi:MAG: hypothetical protein ACKOSQ_11205 [Planctomycetaceae bacterium]
MIDAIVSWFVVGMFVAGLGIVATALVPESTARSVIEGDAVRTRRRAGRPSA